MTCARNTGDALGRDWKPSSSHAPLLDRTRRDRCFANGTQHRKHRRHPRGAYRRRRHTHTPTSSCARGVRCSCRGTTRDRPPLTVPASGVITRDGIPSRAVTSCLRSCAISISVAVIVPPRSRWLTKQKTSQKSAGRRNAARNDQSALSATQPGGTSGECVSVIFSEAVLFACTLISLITLLVMLRFKSR